MSKVDIDCSALKELEKSACRSLNSVIKFAMDCPVSKELGKGPVDPQLGHRICHRLYTTEGARKKCPYGPVHLAVPSLPNLSDQSL